MKQELEELWAVIRSIPAGRVSSYGDVGRALSRPASGYLVGRWMAQASQDVPWWRVVAKTGDVVTGKRDPELAREQLRLLKREGVECDNDVIASAAFWVP